jgi:hypothetical protein
MRRLPDAKIIIQSQLNNMEWFKGTRVGDAYDRICFLEKEFDFNHIQGSLSQSEFDDIVRKLTLVLCPYDPDTYKNQTSGILSDTLSINAIPVVTKGTWLADQLVTIPESMRLVADFSSISFIDCVMKYASNPEAFHEHYADFSEAWYKRHNANVLIDEILRICT